MTGFGQSIFDNGQIQISVEIRTLNSKFLDLNIRLPKLFSERELEVRSLISEKLERGKISITIDYLHTGTEEAKQTYNGALFKVYYTELKKLADSVEAPYQNIFNLALEAPDVIQTRIKEEATEEEWNKIRTCINDAVSKCEQFRVQEGVVLEKMLRGCIRSIDLSLKQVEKLDPRRVERIREKLKGNIVSFFGEEGYDTNRLEQEIIFYIEKFDINEEKVRLTSHLNYFLEVLSEPQANGKKLSFISQEIGREINTIGSKANDADIQKCVVVMKEELEKIKEQLNNVL